MGQCRAPIAPGILPHLLPHRAASLLTLDRLLPLWLGLALLLVATAAAPAPQQHDPGRHATRRDPALSQAMQRALPTQGLAIGVVLRRDDLPSHGPQRRTPLRARQQRVLDQLPGGFRLRRRYQSISGLSGWADAAAIAALEAHPEVEYVYLQPKLHFTLSQGVPLVGGDSAHALGYTGSGVNVAVIDSGIDTNHSDLIDGIVFQQCFCDNAPGPNAGCCPNGDDDQSGGNAAEDVVGHGTQVSGVISSDGNVAGLGIAPDAGIVAIRVADQNFGPAFSDVEAAIDWVITNHATYDIEIINMSLGDSSEHNDTASCVGTNLANAIQTATNMGIIVFASSGNEGHDDGISFPACIPEVISVGGTYDAAVGSASWCLDSSCTQTCKDNPTAADQFVCHSNSDELLDLLAPDWRTRTSTIGGGLQNVGGTSFASPYAAGQAAVLRQADPSLTPAQMRTLLQAHGPLVTNPDNGLQFRRSDLAQALITLVGTDSDSDGIFDDGDLSGTAGDGTCSAGATTSCDDNCIDDANADQADGDADGVGDVCDLCPNDPLNDADGDGVCGDVDLCEGFDDNLDADSDGTPDGCDACPNDPLNDADGDGVCGDVDLCEGFDDNLDFDGDGIPDGCDDDDDADGLFDIVETNTQLYISPLDTGSNPMDADSDDDGFPDGLEVRRGSDPNDDQSLPMLLVPGLSPTALLGLVGLLAAAGQWALRRRSGATLGP